MFIEFDLHAPAILGVAAFDLALDPAPRSTYAFGVADGIGERIAGFKTHQLANRCLDTFGGNLFDDFFDVGIFFGDAECAGMLIETITTSRQTIRCRMICSV
jgi:hypothetical protein